MQKVDPKDFAKRVIERRLQLEWSQGRLAAESGQSQTNIGVIESGKLKDPRKQVVRLAEAMKVHQNWLLYAKGPKELGPPPMPPSEYAALSLDEQSRVTAFLEQLRSEREEA